MNQKAINNKYCHCDVFGEEWVLSRKKDEFECLLSMPDLGKYVGKWIAIVDAKVIFTADTGKMVFKKAREKYPRKTPLIMKVPSNANMLL